MNGTNGVHFSHLPDGKKTGAYAELASQADYDLAIKLDKEYMGHRFVDVLPSDKFRMSRNIGSQHPNIDDKESGVTSDCLVKVRGMPLRCTKESIARFFTDNTEGNGE